MPHGLDVFLAGLLLALRLLERLAELVEPGDGVAELTTDDLDLSECGFELFDPASGDNKPVATDALHSAHGTVWHEKRETLFALGLDVLREYKVENKTLRLLKEWKIPGESGHELTLSPDGQRFLVTEHTGAWQFDIEKEAFSKIEGFPDAENIKSLNLASNGQYLFTVPGETWWTYHVTLHRPDQRLAFPGMKVYKARWYRE